MKGTYTLKYCLYQNFIQVTKTIMEEKVEFKE